MPQLISKYRVLPLSFKAVTSGRTDKSERLEEQKCLHTASVSANPANVRLHAVERSRVRSALVNTPTTVCIRGTATDPQYYGT